MVGRPWLVILAVALVLLVHWAKGTREQPHEVRLVFDSAVSLYSGLDVRVDGLDAGKIKHVENEDAKAIVTIGISDEQVWPLHQGTKAALRFGSTIGNGTRLIDLQLGPASAPTIPDHGIITDENTVETTEFDDVFDTFDKKTRAKLQGTLQGTATTFGPRAKALGNGVRSSAPALDSLTGLAGDLTADEPALRAFVANTYRVTATLGARRQQISDIVRSAAVTFRAFAQRTQRITASLDRLPGTLQEVRSTLARTDGSVDHLRALVTDLDPGARRLAALSRQLRPALADLRRTVPVAVSTFHTARRAAPPITALLKQSEPFSRSAAPVLAKLAPMLSCIRPYAPEAAGLLTTWTSWAQPYDNTAHLGRIWGNLGGTSLDDIPVNSTAWTKATGQGYALVRAPGYNAGKPWYQPQCGITADGTDATKDPEARK
jgi:virulence factor Mce-like protein